MDTSDSQPTKRLAPIGPKSESARVILPTMVLAFDPGGTTGWTQAFIPGGPLAEMKLDDFEMQFGSLGPDPHHEDLFDFIGDAQSYCYRESIRLHLVTEAFTFRQFATDESYGKAKVDLISCEYIGIIKLIAEMYDLPIKSYMASEGKGFVTNEKLEKMGWLQVPKTPKRHINDATRQLVCYLVKEMRIYSPIISSWRDED
jgi:hypothetical protein